MNELQAASEAAPREPRPRLPGSIWALGFVSMFMDISSEMIHGLLPVYLVIVLGASTEVVGLIEGFGEATASISKVFSGWISDWLGKRKALAIMGYALGALSKPLFALAPTAPWVLVARFSDRIGKGVRGAPRDALVADLAPSGLCGAAYGLRQSLDTIGAFAGPLLAMALMVLLNDNYRLIFWLAAIPGLIAVTILILRVQEPAPIRAPGQVRTSIDWSELSRLDGLFWSIVAVGIVLTLARFSEAFLILRAGVVGLPSALAPLMLVVMNVVYGGAAYPMGVWSDRLGRKLILAAGFGVLILADIILVLASNVWMAMVAVGLWGLHMGMTQGLFAAFVADTAPSECRGAAFGLFNFSTGIALLFASLLAGFLWDLAGPSTTFLAGAAFATLGLLAAVALTLKVR